MNPDGAGADSGGDGARAGSSLEERLFPGIGPGIRLGLDRVEEALEALGRPHGRYPVLQVGGTNGKGSVAVVWAAALQAAGFRVGLFTSPHLCSFRERFVVDGEPAGEAELEAGAPRIRPVAERHGLSFFEASTLLAFHLFAQRGVDAAVMEVGLGGRLDATTVADPVVTAVTNVSLDHREYLGDTLEDVAREKAGIARSGVPFVTSEREAGIRSILWEGARGAGAPFQFLDPDAEVRDLTWGPEGTRFRMATETWGELTLESPLPGWYQAANVAVAVRALEHLPPELLPHRRAVVEGVRVARNPGRLQMIQNGGRSWLLDVAHNPAGAHSLAASMDGLSLPEPITFVVGILADKDWKGILAALGASAQDTILTVPPSAAPGRMWDPAEAAAGLSPSPEVEPDFDRALARAHEASAPGGSVVVTGSFATVGDALSRLGCPSWPRISGTVHLTSS